MKKLVIIAIITAVALITVVPVNLADSLAVAKNSKIESSSGSEVVYLGKAVDPKSGQLVEGYAFIHKKDEVKPDSPGNSSAKRPKPGNQCYAFFASGAKWKSIEDWLVNPSNRSALGSSFVFNSLANSINTWEDASDGNVDGLDINIFGNGSATDNTLVIDETAPDDVNEVYFADIDSPGTIAVTVVWGYFGGPPRFREIIEWDMVFDDVSFNWAEDAEGSTTQMDFLNIAMHEMGHSFGMAHPDLSCTEETMHRYASEGEIIKRDLNTGDIAGISALY